MEVSLINSQTNFIRKSELKYRELGFFNSNGKVFPNKTRVFMGRTRNLKLDPFRFTLNGARSELVVESQKFYASSRRSEPKDGVRLFVGLPLDAVSDCNTLTHARAIAVGLKALKLLGIEGVELPIWWGVVEKQAIGKYEWSAYLAIAEMVKEIGLKLHVSICFHGSKTPKISLPEWVSQIGETDPSIFFTDRSGEKYKDCLSLAVDDLPVLSGKTPIQVYQQFFESFKSSFSSFLGSTITGVTIGLGPDGELRYPSHHHSPKINKIPGVGEFQCYDQNMLAHIKQFAEKINPHWGLGGPHDAPSYDQTPNRNNFLKEDGGSWETHYGDFFLSWYSSQLISHANNLLSAASATFSDTPITVSGKIPLMHSWYETRSHASELTAGFYNTVNKNGYESVAEIFARNSCKMILLGMDLSDEHQPQGSFSRPELLLAQIKKACKKHGVEVSGQNSSVGKTTGVFEQIKKNLLGENAGIDLFTYQRMGAYFFSPEHFPSFSEFVRSLDQFELHSDDLPENTDEDTEYVQESLELSGNVHLQTA